MRSHHLKQYGAVAHFTLDLFIAILNAINFFGFLPNSNSDHYKILHMTAIAVMTSWNIYSNLLVSDLIK